VLPVTPAEGVFLLLSTIFQLTPQLVFLVPVKIAAVIEGVFEGRSGSVESYFDIVQRQAKDIGYFGILKTLKVLEDQGDSVFLRKTVDEAAYSRIHLFSDDNVLEGSCGWRGAIEIGGQFFLVGRFSDRIFFEGCTSEPVPGNICCDAVYPG